MTDDFISRQAAIDTVDKALTRVFVEHRDIAEKMINKIPSAQPIMDAVPVIRCMDCKHYADECCDRYADETLGYVHSTQEYGYCWVAERKEE